MSFDTRAALAAPVPMLVAARPPANTDGAERLAPPKLLLIKQPEDLMSNVDTAVKEMVSASLKQWPTWKIEGARRLRMPTICCRR